MCPLVGLALDKVGNRPLFCKPCLPLVLTGTALNVVAHTILAVIPNENNPVAVGVLCYGLVGLGYSFFTATVWPCIPYLVSSKTVGTAIGIAYCVQACGVSIGSFFVGVISARNVNEHGKIVYVWVFVYLAGAALLATAGALVLAALDKRRGGVLFSKDPKAVIARLQEEVKESN